MAVASWNHPSKSEEYKMKMNALILTLTFISLLVVSACAQQPAQPQPTIPLPTDSNATQLAPTVRPGGPVVSTAVGSSLNLSQITPEVTSSAVDPTTGGPITVTLDDQGKTVNLPLGQNFLLKLGETYTWDISISDQSVISRVRNIAVILGAQGVYESLKPGIVTLSASGDPLCRQSKPACGQPSIQFTVTIVVK
jgi:hypothetical protein